MTASPPVLRALVGVLGLATCLAGCPAEREASDGRVDDAADAADVSDDTAADETPGLLIGRSDPRYAPLGAGLCAGAPASLEGATVWVDQTGLWLAQNESTSTTTPVLIDRLPADAVARSPLALHTGPGEPAIALALARPTTCELRFYRRSGELIDTVVVATSRCTNPSGSGGYLMWPIGVGEEGGEESGQRGQLGWIDIFDRREVATIAMEGSPLTPAAAFGQEVANGGGSHWLVGTTRGLVAIKDPLSDRRLEPGTTPEPIAALPSIVGTWSPASGHVTSVVVVGAMAIASLQDPDGDGLGSRIQVLRIDYGTGDAVVLTPTGEPILAPGPLTAHLVGLVCAPNRPSTWACPHDVAGLFVAGGAGWLAGWHLTSRAPDGTIAAPGWTPAFERESPVTWTGVTLGRGGWVAGGGSHWLPGPDPAAPGWSLLALDPSSAAPPAELATDTGAACVPSPLWDTNGVMRAPVLGPGLLVRAGLPHSTGARGVATGPSRPLGNARNTGAPERNAGVCFDGGRRGLGVSPLGDEQITALLNGEDRTVLIGSRAGTGFIRWLDADGVSRDVVVADASRIVDGLVLAEGEVVILYVDKATGGAFGARYDQDRGLLWSHPLTSLVGEPVGVVQGLEGEFVAMARSPDFDTIASFESDKGAVGGTTIGAIGEPVGLQRVVSDHAGGAFMVLDLGATIGLRHAEARDGTVAITDALFTWQGAADDVVVVGATADAGNHVRVLIKEGYPGGATSIRLLHFDAALTLVDERPLPWVGELATQFDGVSLILTDGGPLRVAADGSVGPVRAMGGSLYPGLGVVSRGIAPTFDGFVIAYERSDESGRYLVWGHADRFGFTSCADAGLCIQSDEGACDDPTPCAIRGCAPATGLCEELSTTPTCGL